MKPENAIEVSNITKSFKVYLDKGNTMKERVLFHNRRKYEKRDILNGISFDVKKGEAIGLIGHNGCGKSTTLKLLSRIMYPDSGTIEMKGRVSCLIELGAGFHPDMSGRENIYINASIFGLTRKEIDKKLNDIISFSELEEFIDNPVRTYSSGMYMRLAFAVAINVDADILLIDEILAVGDVSFQSKCFNRLREIKHQGTTIVIVSHSLSQIEQICDCSYWIHDGLIRKNGNPSDVHIEYMSYMSDMSLAKDNKKTKEEKNDKEDEVKHNEKPVSINKMYLCNSDGEVRKRFFTNQKVILNIEYTANIDEIEDDPLIGILIFRNDGVAAYGTNTRNEHINDIKLKRKGIIKFEINNLALITGQYWIDVAVRNQDMFPYDYCSKGVTFSVLSTCNEVGIARINHSWQFDN